MKPCTVTTLQGPLGKMHYGIVALGKPNWPLALCGLVDGPNARQSLAEARLFADAPVMVDMLEHLVNTVKAMPSAPDALLVLAERSASLCDKHGQVRGKQSRDGKV